MRMNDSYPECCGEPGITEDNFRERADLSEGISGQRAIDSEFENTSRGQVNKPRSSDVTANELDVDGPKRARY